MDVIDTIKSQVREITSGKDRNNIKVKSGNDKIRKKSEMATFKRIAKR